MMSSVNLLFQAASCGGGVSSCISRADDADHKRALFANMAAESLHPKIYYSDIKTSSLPPKKRARIETDVEMSSTRSETPPSPSASARSIFSGYGDSPTLNSECSEAVAAEMKRREELLLRLQLCDTAIVPVRNRGGNRRSARTSNRKRRRLPNSRVKSDIKSKKAVKDVDGNDVCMGYFSMLSQKSSPQDSGVAEEKEN